MTISATVGSRPTITEICLRAYQGVGLRSTQQGTDDVSWQSDFAFAKYALDEIINELAVYGVQAKAATFYNLALVVGTYKYTLPDAILDLLGNAVHIDADEDDLEKASGETMVRAIQRGEWQIIAAKNAEGRPALYYTHREGEQVQAWLWPIPAEAGTVRFQVHRKLADTDDGNATLDLEEYWHSYITSALMHRLARAKTLPLTIQNMLASEAFSKLQDAKGKAAERPSPPTRLDHPTPWGRFR